MLILINNIVVKWVAQNIAVNRIILIQQNIEFKFKYLRFSLNDKNSTHNFIQMNLKEFYWEIHQKNYLIAIRKKFSTPECLLFSKKNYKFILFY